MAYSNPSGQAGGSGKQKSMDEITNALNDMSLLSFRNIEDLKRLAWHFNCIIDHPLTQEKKVILNYLKNLNEMHRKIFTQKREVSVVEYVYAAETKNNQQRQRFNSLSVSEVSELLKMEFGALDKSQKVHICTECNVQIETNDEEPLMESLQRHFDLEVHQPKKEVIDVAESIVLPNMSRRKSAMEQRGETLPQATLESLERIVKNTEKLDRLFLAKLEGSLVRNLPNNSESYLDAAVKFYQGVFDALCREISSVDFTALTSSVAPIIMSIKDNVNQNFTVDANKNFENEENEHHATEKPPKNQVKKFRYYGPIESGICRLLMNHKLLTLMDDRTGKPAFFCMACEYYTLRFRYDSVLNHVFSETHIHNLSCILEADPTVPFCLETKSIEKIKELNRKFLLTHSVASNGSEKINCGLCKVNIDSPEASILHILEENHLGRLSDALFRKARSSNPDGTIPEEWGPKSMDWAKFLAGMGKALLNKDHVVIENFIKPLGKVANQCTCCDLTLKGPRQVLFNHVRQKKHLRNAAPHKLQLLYKNHCRPCEYYASFGNYYICAICPDAPAMPSFSAVVEHFEGERHIETICKLLRFALTDQNENNDQIVQGHSLLNANRVFVTSEQLPYLCSLCDVQLPNAALAVTHILSNIQHQNAIVEEKYNANKGDIISVYMKGNYILHMEGTTFTCSVCKGVFGSLRSLLTHLVYAEHFVDKPSAENVFRFYLELKHNINLLLRNKYMYLEFGKLRCGVCEAYLEDSENAKRHVISARHRESMGASYTSVVQDVSATE